MQITARHRRRARARRRAGARRARAGSTRRSSRARARLRRVPRDAGRVPARPRRRDHRRARRRRSSGSPSRSAPCSPLTICAGFGMQRYTNSGQAMRAILALLALTGNIGRPGAGWVYAEPPDAGVLGREGPARVLPARARRGSRPRVGVDGAARRRDMLAQRDPPLRMAWIERGNPVTQQPQTAPCCGRCARSTSASSSTSSSPTRRARRTSSCPPRTMFEQSDVIGAYWHHYLQLKQKVIEPPRRGEAGVGDLLAARRAAGLRPAARRRSRRRSRATTAVEAYLDGAAGAVSGADARPPARGPGASRPAPRRSRSPTSSSRRRRGGSSSLSARPRARWGVDDCRGFAAGRAAGAGAGASRCTCSPPTPRTASTRSSATCRRSAGLAPAPFVAMHPRDARARGLAGGHAPASSTIAAS